MYVLIAKYNSRPRFVLQDMGVVRQRDIYDWLERDIPAPTVKKNGKGV